MFYKDLTLLLLIHTQNYWNNLGHHSCQYFSLLTVFGLLRTTSVYANVLNVPLPFIGVDGTSACDKLFKADGTTPSSCPLKAGETYVYKNSFPILEFYPKLNLVVHDSLT
ncbi:hypothetical protein HA402_000009 [Bradysia odoriphaga]|nr:hypothetical protein HA402_000009 [Bradysia odoriphaga]